MKDTIIAEIRQLIDDPEVELNADTRLIGSESALDSMNLVSLCLRLEELAEEAGFEFDWTSEAAMSKSRGMFRTISALASEYVRQRDAA